MSLSQTSPVAETIEESSILSPGLIGEPACRLKHEVRLRGERPRNTVLRCAGAVERRRRLQAGRLDREARRGAAEELEPRCTVSPQRGHRYATTTNLSLDTRCCRTSR